MNRSEIRTNMRLLLNEDLPGFWTDEDLNKCINMACQHVNSIVSGIKEDYFTQSATFATIIGTKSYELPTDCRFVRRMEVYDLSDPNKIYKIDEIKFPRTEASGPWPYPQNGRPIGYYLIGTHFDLQPLPDDIYPMRIYYDVRKNDLATDSDTPSIPYDFHDIVTLKGIVFASTIEGSPTESSVELFNTLFMERKEELIQTLLRRGSDDPKTVEGWLEGVI